MSIVGVDEVGRGCWAGPLVAAAVMLDKPVAGLADSKTLSKARRAELAVLILEKALATGIGWVSPKEVDELGLTGATKLAISRAIEFITLPYDQIVIDGNINYLQDNPKATTMVKADSILPEASAASIIAKVARDSYMRELPDKYSKYKFDQHVGYGTLLHKDLLKLYGICDLHRTSYKPVKLAMESLIND